MSNKFILTSGFSVVGVVAILCVSEVTGEVDGVLNSLHDCDRGVVSVTFSKSVGIASSEQRTTPVCSSAVTGLIKKHSLHNISFVYE